MTNNLNHEQLQKCAWIALIGAPNAGKSTLLNSLIGYKLAITSPKVQTTRNIIQGIYTDKDTQLIFVDTPGIFLGKTKLERLIVKSAWSSINERDFICVIIDSKKGICSNTSEIITELKKRDLNVILICNKIDLLNEHKLQQLKDNLKEHYHYIQHIFYISAKTLENLDSFKEYLINHAPYNRWGYGEDDITNLPMRFIAAEFTREQLFLKLKQELPYNLTVETEKWEQFADGSIKIHQIIYVTKNSHKSIVLGNQGSFIKEVGIKAREEIEQLIENKVHLFLFVKVRNNWLDNPEYYIENY